MINRGNYLRSPLTVFMLTLICSLVVLLATFFSLCVGWVLSRGLYPILNALVTTVFGLIGFISSTKGIWELSVKMSKNEEKTTE